MGGPGGLVVAEIGVELLAAPVALRRVRDRREGREAAVAVGVGHGDGQRTVPAHRVPGDPLARGVERKGVEEDVRQVGGDMVPHPEVPRPGVAHRVDVEPGALPEVIGRVVRHAVAPGRGVGEDHRDAVTRGMGLRTGLHHRVLVGAGEPRQIPEHRDLPCPRLRRKVEAEGHVAVGRGRAVGVDPLHPAKAGILGLGLHRVLRYRAVTSEIIAERVKIEAAVEIRIVAETRCGAIP